VSPEFFEALGFHIEQIRGASPCGFFRFRFPWLLVTSRAARSQQSWPAFLSDTRLHSFGLGSFSQWYWTKMKA